MGILVWPHDKRLNEAKKQGPIIYYNNNYANRKAVANVLHDITRTRDGEKYGYQLICYGACGCGYNITPDEMIKEFLCIQNMYNIEGRKGRRMYHELFSLCDEEVAALFFNPTILNDFAMECARWYYEHGFQVVYAVHKQGRFHIHFAVNSINYYTGAKFHTSKSEMAIREQLFNQILYRYQTGPKIPVVPIQFYNT